MATTQQTQALGRMEALAGSWIGKEKWHPSPIHPKGYSADARTESRMVLSGAGLVQDYEHLKHGHVDYAGHSVLRWHEESGDYVMHVFDAAGDAPQEYRGRFEDDTFTLIGEGPGGIARTIMKIVSDDAFHLRYDLTSDGAAWTPLMEAAYERRR